MSNKKAYENKTIEKINTEQLKKSANTVNVVKELSDAPTAFVENGIVGVDERLNTNSDPNLSFGKFGEMNRFNKSYKTKIEKE